MMGLILAVAVGAATPSAAMVKFEQIVEVCDNSLRSAAGRDYLAWSVRTEDPASSLDDLDYRYKRLRLTVRALLRERLGSVYPLEVAEAICDTKLLSYLRGKRDMLERETVVTFLDQPKSAR